ncbi:hypothetical protein ABN584_25260 [Gloeocapsa sp. BRSZ]
MSNEARDQYMQLLQNYRNDSSLTYDNIAQNNVEQLKQYDQEVFRQALSKEMPVEQFISAIAQGPYVQNQLNADKQQANDYLAEIQKSYVAVQKSQQLENTEMPSIQKNLREAEDYALGIVQMLDQRRLNVDRFQIDVNEQTVFKMRDGDLDTRNTKITDEHAELIKKALNDPASLNGSVKITQGNQVLLHVKDGRVIIDAVGLSKQSAKIEVNTPDSPSKGLYERFSKEVSGNGLQATKDIATNALKAGISREQVVDLLKTHDPSYQKLAQEQGMKVADQTLEKLVDTTQAKLVQEKMPQQPLQQPKASKSKSVKA